MRPIVRRRLRQPVRGGLKVTARAALYTLLRDDAELATLGVQKVYGSNTADSPPEDCFLVVQWQTDEAPAFARKAPNRVSIWAHDKDPDFGRIEKVLKRVDDLVLATVHRAGSDGWTMTMAEFRGHGPDLRDDGYGTVTKWTDFTVVSRYSTA